MNNSHTCIFCGEVFNLNSSTYSAKNIYFKDSSGITMPFNNYYFKDINNQNNNSDLGLLTMFKCPNEQCNKTQIIFSGIGDQYPKGYTTNVFPKAAVKQYPKYIPTYIRQDYTEACEILNISPKASSTLSRRVLEEILVDFYKLRSGSLINKINRLKDKNVNTRLTQSLHSLRQIGNIGAHLSMDTNRLPKNITKDEAKILIEIIDIVINETYINNHTNKVKMNKINKIGKDLKNK